MKKKKSEEANHTKLEIKGSRNTTVNTLYGPLNINRRYLCGKDSSIKPLIGKGSIFPLDERLGIDSLPYNSTCAVMSAIAFESVRASSFDDAQKRIENRLRDTFSTSFIWNITNYVGFIAVEDRNKRVGKLIKAFESGNPKSVFDLYNDVDIREFLYFMTDGLFLNTHPIDIHRIINQISTWRECKSGMVFDPCKLEKKQTGKNGEERYTIKGADYDAIIGSADEALFVFLDLMLRNGLKEDTTVILVSDGADWIQNINEKILKPLGVHVIAINDLYHTKQNIGLFCKYVNEKIEGKEKGYENTLPLDANLISKLVENGEIDEALVILRPHESLKAKNLVNAYSYINDL